MYCEQKILDADLDVQMKWCKQGGGHDTAREDFFPGKDTSLKRREQDACNEHYVPRPAPASSTKQPAPSSLKRPVPSFSKRPEPYFDCPNCKVSRNKNIRCPSRKCQYCEGVLDDEFNIEMKWCKWCARDLERIDFYPDKDASQAEQTVCN